MATRFGEAVAPLAARMPRAARDIEIPRVSAQFDGDDLAAAATKLDDVELTRGSRNCSAVRISGEALEL